MKKLLLILILSLFTQHTSHSQEWFPVGAKYTWEWKISLFSTVDYVPETYQVIKDTIIKSRNAKMLQRVGGAYNSWALNTIYLYDTAGIVYYYPPIPNWMSEDKWSLLMNFNKDIGDTVLYKNMKGFGLSSDTLEYFNYVYSIDTVNVNGLMVRCFEMHPSFDFTFNSFEICPCEYILGCMPPTIVGGDWGTGGIDYRFLRCYEDSFVGLYNNPNFNLECDTAYNTSGVGFEELIKDSIFKIYPNPAKSSITIQSDKNFSDPIVLRLFELHGTLRKEYRMVEIEGNLDISDLPSGMYIYELESTEGTFRNKLIIE